MSQSFAFRNQSGRDVLSDHQTSVQCLVPGQKQREAVGTATDQSVYPSFRNARYAAECNRQTIGRVSQNLTMEITAALADFSFLSSD
jgi:hypothetical protein